MIQQQQQSAVPNPNEELAFGDESSAAAKAKAEKARTKQLKKEEGRRRAIEIAQERQRQRRQQQKEKKRQDQEGSGDTSADITFHACVDDDANQEWAPRSGRHGARNQHRHKCFAKWLLQAFPHLRAEQAAAPQRDQQQHVLDVAGGKGELAARLSMCHNLHVVLVDPRKADVSACFSSTVLPKLPKKWQQRIGEQIVDNPNFVANKIDERVQQLVMNFDDDAIEHSAELQAAIQSSSLLIGVHADGATEAIVDAALKYDKPFVVVPCCVFPRLFNQRYLIREDGCKVQVRSHDQFCQYLLEKDERCTREILPFEGRNVAIWWDGKKEKE